MCPSHSNNSPNLVMGSGPLTRDNCQSPEYGLVNRSSGHGGSGIPLVGETHVLRGQVLPSGMGSCFGVSQSERDAWKVRRMPNSSSMESSMLQPSVHPLVVGRPQFSGHQTLAFGGVAQATGQDAGFGFGVDEEQEVLLRQLSMVDNGQMMLQMLEGCNLEDEAWPQLLRRIMSTADVGEPPIPTIKRGSCAQSGVQR